MGFCRRLGPADQFRPFDDGARVDLHLKRLWSQNISITNAHGGHGLDGDAAEDGSVQKNRPTRLITHHFKLDQTPYETFSHAAQTQALKVIIEA